MTEVRRVSKDEWLAEAKELFGEDAMKWRFVCPLCSHVQSVADFKEVGGQPQDAYQECIGRHLPKEQRRSALEDDGEGPCDYAAYGLLFCGNMIVVDGDREVKVFDFDRAKD
jgi:hypothetical protein